MELFSSAKHFQTVFNDGLKRLVELPDVNPGQLVLVLGNAVVLRDHDLVEAVRHRAKPLLEAPGASVQGSGEDVQVLRLVLGSTDPFELIHHRTTPKGYFIQYNQLRAFRPRREAGAAATTIKRPYDSTKFNFSRIPGESYWRGSIGGREVAFYYNKYPVGPYHTSVVPEPDAGHAQFLSVQLHRLGWGCREIMAASHPDTVLAYNSLGAYASVNHLHFQTIADASTLSLIKAHDLAAYPVPTAVYTDPGSAWDHINRLQSADRPFNLIYAPGRVIVIERRFQGGYPEPAWTTGFAWYELSGGIITIDKAAFDQVTDDQIEAAFKAATADLAASA
jgi:hypothetical protein